MIVNDFCIAIARIVILVLEFVEPVRQVHVESFLLVMRKRCAIMVEEGPVYHVTLYYFQIDVLNYMKKYVTRCVLSNVWIVEDIPTEV